MLNKKVFFIKLLFAGIISGVSISFSYLIPIFFLGYYIFLTDLITHKKLKQSFASGWIFGFGYFLGSMHWIINPFLVYEQHFILAPFALIIFPTIMAFFFIIPCILITEFNRVAKLNSNYFFCKCFVISLIFFTFEYLRSFLFGGLPLNLTSHIWVFNERFISIVSYVGVFGLSFITIFWMKDLFQP